jgi:hypothetical protein
MAMGGVGEAMLLGAAMGGGSAALTGGDPLKGALLGGLTGGIGGGASTLAANTAANTAANAGTSALTAAGTEAATSAAMANVLPASTMAATPMAATGLPAGQSFAQASQLANTAAANQAVTGAMGQALPLSANAGISGLPAASTSPFMAAPSAVPSAATATAPQTFTEGMAQFASNPMASIKASPFTAGSAAIAGALGGQEGPETPGEYDGPLKRFRFNPETYRAATFADGGIANLAVGGYDRMVGEQPMYQALARGGISDLGGYSDYAGGGRMLKGPGDGMSDSIPASISGKRPARLADGEFVVPADVVSHLGNGSTDAGARHLYSMMDKVRKARTGSKKQGREINPRKYALA